MRAVGDYHVAVSSFAYALGARLMPPLNESNMIARAHCVSASEVAALMPEGHPYVTALDVYERLAGIAKTRPATLPMRIGTHLEPGILSLACEEYGWRVRANSHTSHHRTAPLVATPDAKVIGAPELVEVKYSARSELWTNLPAHVYWQAQTQIACNETIELVHVVVLAGGRLLRFDVERNNAAVRRLCKAAHRMLERLESGDPPEPTVRGMSAEVRSELFGDIPVSLLLRV